VTVRHNFAKCETTSRIRNFDVASAPRRAPSRALRLQRLRRLQVIEGASYSCASVPTPSWDAYLDGRDREVKAAQSPDGYLYTAGQIPTSPRSRPAASAGPAGPTRERPRALHTSATSTRLRPRTTRRPGNRSLLDAALKSARSPDVRSSAPAGGSTRPATRSRDRPRQALAATGEKEVPRPGALLLEQRGRGRPQAVRRHTARTTCPCSIRRRRWPPCGGTSTRDGRRGRPHRRPGLRPRLDALWESVVFRKLYVTGGLGARREGEAFGDDYELPSLTATPRPAPRSRGMWNHGCSSSAASEYVDVLERIIYNGFLSGVSRTASASSTRTRWPRPGTARSTWGRRRSEWFDCSCCPTNVVRFLPSIPGYVYAQPEGHVRRTCSWPAARDRARRRPHGRPPAGDALPVGRDGEDRRRALAGRRGRLRVASRAGRRPSRAGRPLPVRSGRRAEPFRLAVTARP